MSIEALAALYEPGRVKTRSAIGRAVLAFLALKHNPQILIDCLPEDECPGRKLPMCCVTYETIAEATGVGRSTVPKILKAAEEELDIQRHYRGYRKATNYELLWPGRDPITVKTKTPRRKRIGALSKRFARAYEKVYKVPLKAAAEDWRHCAALVDLYDDDLLKRMMRTFFSMRMYTGRDPKYASHPMRTFWWLRTELVESAKSEAFTEKMMEKDRQQYDT